MILQMHRINRLHMAETIQQLKLDELQEKLRVAAQIHAEIARQEQEQIEEEASRLRANIKALDEECKQPSSYFDEVLVSHEFKRVEVKLFDSMHPIDWNDDRYDDSSPEHAWGPDEDAIVTEFSPITSDRWKISTRTASLRMKLAPFANGGMRFAYYLELNGRKYVAKESMRTNPEDNCELFFLTDIIQQMRAKRFADAFMVSLATLSSLAVGCSATFSYVVELTSISCTANRRGCKERRLHRSESDLSSRSIARWHAPIRHRAVHGRRVHQVLEQRKVHRQ